MKYELHKIYKINPFKALNEPGYDAEFVGYIRIDKLDKYPIFKFDFYKHRPPTCFMALTEEGACLCHCDTVDELMIRFRALASYYGSQHTLISVGSIKLTREDFVTQVRNCNVSNDIVTESIHKGYYVGTHASGGGEIKWCPTCKVIRVTTCSVCGCGECTICKHRWSCNGGSIPQNFVTGVVVNPPQFLTRPHSPR